MNLPKLYNLESGSANILVAMGAVKWLLVSIFGMLAAGFVILYRKGNPIRSADDGASTAGEASKNARGRG